MCVARGAGAAPNNTDTKTNFINTIHMTQVVQAVCMKFEAEHYRRLRSQGTANTSGYTMGTLYWQANDIWQGASWSSQDYTGRWCVLLTTTPATPRHAAHATLSVTVPVALQEGVALLREAVLRTRGRVWVPRGRHDVRVRSERQPGSRDGVTGVRPHQLAARASRNLDDGSYCHRRGVHSGMCQCAAAGNTCCSLQVATMWCLRCGWLLVQLFSESVESLQARAPLNCTSAADCVVTFALINLDGEVRDASTEPSLYTYAVGSPDWACAACRATASIAFRSYTATGCSWATSPTCRS